MTFGGASFPKKNNCRELKFMFLLYATDNDNVRAPAVGGRGRVILSAIKRDGRRDSPAAINERA
jgi:hypothetical protein